MIAILYIFMLIFDLVVFAGTAWLVSNGWSPWWFVLATSLAMGSNPTNFVKALK